MSMASFAVPHFLGGEISSFAQGRFDKPEYRFSLNTCFNSYPVEAGSWTRRPGTRNASHTRGGAPGRTIKFDFDQSDAITLEFTDGFVRFREGVSLVTSSTPTTVVAVSSANPAVAQLAAAVTWATGDTAVFPGASTPLLEARQFTLTKVDTTHFSLADALTGATIDGSTLGALVAGATIAKVHERVTPYAGGTWAAIRAVQAETTDILLTATVAPQALVVTTLPSAGVSPAFTVSPANFIDGPYLDPFTNGVQATPGAKSGVIGITLAFPAYDATKAYAVGSFVTSSSVNYISLQDQNVNNTPASSPAFWATTSASAAINNGKGFLGTDIGRLVRFLSEPPAWLVGSTYAAGAVVSYNPSGIPGASTYWSSITSSNTGHAPGTDLTNWTLMPAGAAIWSWGKISSLSNIIDRALASSTSIGDMSSGGGLNSAFNGVFAQASASSAEKLSSGPSSVSISLTSYLGKNYSAASAQVIQQATIYPTTDEAFAVATDSARWTVSSVTFNLRGKSTLPASSSDGTLLGTSGAVANGFAAVTVVSSDQTTAWNYVWVEQITAVTNNTGTPHAFTLNNNIGQLSFFNPPGTGVAAGVNVEILGPPLLYTTPVITWRLGLYSNTTGWPTCGTYNDGRLYLGGAVANRFDASVSNGVVGGSINFAPTDQFGNVPANSAISYTFNSNGVNPILWMEPDLQGIKAGTQAGEWLIQAPTAGPIAPANITARNVTNHGSTNIQPVRTEHTTVFIQRFAEKLLEYFPDVYSGKFTAPNLADKAQHITRNKVAELAYVSAVTPIIWGRDRAGAFFGITYQRNTLATSQGPTFYAWHRHALGSGRVVESLCEGPSPGGDLDSVTMVTNDAATGVRHVEVLTEAMDELSPLAEAWFLDDAVNPTSVSSVGTGGALGLGGLTINGLWHLNGKTVQVFAGGLDCGDPGEGHPPSDFLVTNGSVFVDYGDSISAGPGRGQFTAAYAATLTLSEIVVGFTYNSDAQLVRPILQADTGARNGPGFGKLMRAHRYALKLVNTIGISVGTRFDKILPANLKDNMNNPPAPLTTFSGISQEALQDDDSYDRALCWRISRPWPANVVVAGVNDDTKDQ